MARPTICVNCFHAMNHMGHGHYAICHKCLPLLEPEFRDEVMSKDPCGEEFPRTHERFDQSTDLTQSKRA